MSDTIIIISFDAMNAKSVFMKKNAELSALNRRNKAQQHKRNKVIVWTAMKIHNTRKLPSYSSSSSRSSGITMFIRHNTSVGVLPADCT
jgi:hypothetical protein